MSQTPYPYKKRIAFSYAGLFLSIILLLFVQTLEPLFNRLSDYLELNDLFFGITLIKVLLFILNISLVGISFTPLKIEDERVQQIRAYAFKHTFRIAVLAAVFIGFFLNTKLSLLIYAIIIQCYYLLIFRLSLYRDSFIVYMNEEQLKSLSTKSSKRFHLFTNIFLGIVIMSATLIKGFYHNAELYWVIVLIAIGIFGMVKIAYFSWRQEL